mmetsp:Transcript_16113/g.25084  ORF Transcript_16113/g.25084 Transcript_16113/m.25084 type:complete len:167 (-) Transcript_16113:560-1060(-)
MMLTRKTCLGWHLFQLASALLLFSAGSCDAFTRMSSMSMSSAMPRPRGAAATPAQKKKVAVFGAGGYMGATAFGFLQRAASLYGSGLGGVSSPRSICATATASAAMNKVLSKNFVLSYAGEDMVRLTDMQDSNMIAQRLSGYKAVLMGTTYQLERLPVTFYLSEHA